MGRSEDRMTPYDRGLACRAHLGAAECPNLDAQRLQRAFACISRTRGLGSVASRQCSLQLAGSDGELLGRAHERRDLRRECELDGLFPRHGSSFVKGGVGSRLAEPGTGRGEVALAPGLG